MLAGLLAGACATASCGLLRVPGRIVGGLAHATVEGGKSLHRKAEKASERRKRAKEEKQASAEKTQAGDKPATAPPADGGLLPDLPSEGDPPPQAPAGTGPDPNAPVDPYAVPEALPPLPEL